MKASHKLVVSLAALVGFMFVAMTGPALAGPVQYTAILKAGFADSYHGSISNNGLPVCAQDSRIFLQIAPGVFLPNNLLKHETGTMYGQGYASQGAGTHASIMFPAAEKLASTTATNIAGLTNVGNGGAFARIRATCQVVAPPFINPRLRSRTQFAGGGGPGVAGTLSQNNGLDFVGASLSIPIPFFPPGDGKQQLTKGPRNFGGGLPAVTTGPTIYSSWVSSMNRGLGNGVQLGINTTIITPTATNPATAMVLKTFGKVNYAGGYLPTGPNKAGGDTPTHRASTDPQALPTGMQTTFTNFFAFRTPGGATKDQQGFIKTVGGGNTKGTGYMSSAAINSPFQIRIAIQQLTTGTVLHTDMVGDYLTVRGTTGADLTGLASPGGTTRRLSTVAPFSATINGIGPFGLNAFLSLTGGALGFGGIGESTYNFAPAPVPEPASMLAIGFGTMALFGLHRVRENRRK